MTARRCWLSALACLFIGHTRHKNWLVGPRGVSWECTRCHHLTPSPVLRVCR